jgi:hypothetical protein
MVSRPNVLCVGGSLNPHSWLARRLASWGGECQFTSSQKEVSHWLGRQTFELVISEMHPMGGSALQMIPLLEGSPTSLYCFLPTQDSCLWIPIVERGQICLGAPALRPSDFGRVLRRVLSEGRTVSVSERWTLELPEAPSPIELGVLAAPA